MNMYDSIKSFAKQFEYQPKIENADKLGSYDRFIILGMGGSHLGGDVIKAWKTDFPIVVHSDYGLPHVDDKTLVIASSYSGNTEEVLDGLNLALDKKYSLAAIAIGGKLIDLAIKHRIPYVKMPDTGIQPRSATGFSVMGLLKLVDVKDGLKEVAELATILKPEDFEQIGKNIAQNLKGHIPVIYSSNRNIAVAYNWKIKCNETGKIPAFYNVFPESNHNEMTGFDVSDEAKHLLDNFHPIFLIDDEDHPRIRKRMEVVEKLYKDRGLSVERVTIIGKSRFERIFSSTILADWVAYYTSQIYGADPNEVPMVEKLKRLIA